ncbi:MAG: alpha-2-macroglobulin family protein, partial [Armatimonadota bacterium]
RQDLKDTAFWKADVVTNRDGEAVVSFKAPDNLTSWRTTVRGITTTTNVAEAKYNFTTKKDLMVRLEKPRFLTQHDTSYFSTMVHNDTGLRQKITVKMDAPNLVIDGSDTREITVNDSSSEVIKWKVSAPKSGRIPITISADTGIYKDALRVYLNVMPFGIMDNKYFTGTITADETKTQNIHLHKDFNRDSTFVKIRLAPSLLSSMIGSLEYLAQYPYGCVEQVTSSILPDIILYKNMNQIGIGSSYLGSELPKMIASGLNKLYNMQNDDGSWGWYYYNGSNPWMTAYALNAIIEARSAGFTVNEDILNNGVRALRNIIAQKDIDLHDKAFGYYVLTLTGNAEYKAGMLNTLNSLITNSKDQNRNVKSYAYLALAFNRIGDVENAGIALSNIMQNATSANNMMYWDDDTYYFTQTETTSLALRALIALRPDEPRAENIFRWLMNKRKSSYWSSTRDTAMALYALADYVKISNELTPQFDASVKVNGKEVGKLSFNSASINEPDIVLDIKGTDLKSGSNSIEITKTGTGKLYYTIEVRQVINKKEIPSVLNSSGISIKREYYKPSLDYFSSKTGKIGSQITSCSSGDIILVRLIINSSKSHRYLMLDDYFPAGFEAVDRGRLSPYEWGYWWNGHDIRDNKASFYIDSLDTKDYIIEYKLRARTPGEYKILPAYIFGMYDPDVSGSTSAGKFTIK